MSNGTCSMPEVVTNGRYLGTTANRSNALSPSTCSFGAGGGEAVFQFELEDPMEVLMCVNTERSSIDTVLHVREAMCSSDEAEIACDDDGGESTTSSTSFAAQPDTTYYIVVDSYSTEGNFVLTVEPCP